MGVDLDVAPALAPYVLGFVPDVPGVPGVGPVVARGADQDDDLDVGLRGFAGQDGLCALLDRHWVDDDLDDLGERSVAHLVRDELPGWAVVVDVAALEHLAEPAAFEVEAEAEAVSGL